jgi:hypothetical protein
VLTPLLRATLLPNAAHYGIALSALVRGPRGAGKARAVERAAATVGVGVWEVSPRFVPDICLSISCPPN